MVKKRAFRGVVRYYHTKELFVLSASSYSNCCSYRPSQNTVWYA